MDEERLTALIRAGFDAEIMDLSLPGDLAERVVAARPAPRRQISLPIRRTLLAAGAVGALGVTALVVPVVSDLPESGGHRDPAVMPIPSATAVKPYDPVPVLTLGPMPRGWRSLQGGLREATGAKDRRAGERCWQAAYIPAGHVRRRQLQLLVLTGRVSMAQARARLTGLARQALAPVTIPAGAAEAASVPGRPGEYVAVWQPRPGTVLSLQAEGLTQPQVLAFVRGTSLRV